MQFFSSSQFSWTSSKAPAAMPVRPGSAAGVTKPDSCGWFDSSFDLACGLEVSEHDSTLYQLWELSQH
ncbi:hypothetical protein [Pelomonas cellulosilytica]|uniref:Uncharacterized protein n=1 Tax=Pelomonas cellulosilytica TaxID=2906762 RepID=A0ABS8XSN2_9BURK|nr:hypothetical protein [Pelomonas sp. P8]MCE4555731.1 hypothetical protein [Pelomonas sp. P8]